LVETSIPRLPKMVVNQYLQQNHRNLAACQRSSFIVHISNLNTKSKDSAPRCHLSEYTSLVFVFEINNLSLWRALYEVIGLSPKFWYLWRQVSCCRPFRPFHNIYKIDGIIMFIKRLDVLWGGVLFGLFGTASYALSGTK